MVASLLETILITNILCGSSRYPPLPQWVKVFFFDYIARLVCLSKSDQNWDLEGESYHVKLHEGLLQILFLPVIIFFYYLSRFIQTAHDEIKRSDVQQI